MITISRDTKSLFARVELPASKSISNRLLILQYLYGKALQVENHSRSEDTVLLTTLLDRLRQYRAGGSKGLLWLDAQDAGTVFRFMTALLSATRGQYLLKGSDRMKLRPVGPLVDALRTIGADIEYPENNGYPPLLIKGRTLTGGQLSLDASLSSQFLSALLLIGPVLEEGLTIELTGDRASWPYVAMTTNLMNALGINVFLQDKGIRVFRKEKINKVVRVEPDWSAASFWYGMLSLAEEGEIFFPNLFRKGNQGDEKAASIFSSMGIVTNENAEGTLISHSENIFKPLDIDFSDHPDLALPVILAGAIKELNARITGLERLKLKESDRLAVLRRELLKTGFSLTEFDAGTWRIDGYFKPENEILIDHENDHRVAMTFASLAIRGVHVFMEHPEAVNKSYPGFWQDLKNAGFTIHGPC